jgi:hypothetical protein
LLWHYYLQDLSANESKVPGASSPLATERETRDPRNFLVAPKGEAGLDKFGHDAVTSPCGTIGNRQRFPELMEELSSLHARGGVLDANRFQELAQDAVHGTPFETRAAKWRGINFHLKTMTKACTFSEFGKEFGKEFRIDVG